MIKGAYVAVVKYIKKLNCGKTVNKMYITQ